MIELMFTFGTDHILVVVNGHDVKFGSTAQGAQMAGIEGIKLSKDGVVREFPDLKDNPEWKAEAIKRFKEKVKTLDSEDAICNYIIDDLKKHGYKPYYKQVAGHRKVAIQ